jgi:hypothetical protein
MKALFYGDNLDVLRKSIPDQSVDLIYLDPPFNSNASYNVLFRAPMVKEAAAAGFFDTPFGKFPRLQIATVSDVLAGKLPKLPPQEKGGGYKQAGLEEMAKQYKLI